MESTFNENDNLVPTTEVSQTAIFSNLQLYVLQ